MVSFCAILFPPDVLDEIWDLIESVSASIPTYSNKLVWCFMGENRCKGIHAIP